MMRKAMIVRVTATEFETDRGRVFPHPVPFEEDQVPSVEDFQKWYDHWFALFCEEFSGERIAVLLKRGEDAEEG